MGRPPRPPPTNTEACTGGRACANRCPRLSQTPASQLPPLLASGVRVWPPFLYLLGSSSETPGQPQAAGLGREGEGTLVPGESGFCGQGTRSWRWTPRFGEAVGWPVCPCVHIRHMLHMAVYDCACPAVVWGQDMDLVRAGGDRGLGPPWASRRGLRFLSR